MQIHNYIIYDKKWPLREDTQGKLSYIIAKKKKINLLKIKEDDNIDILYSTHLGEWGMYALQTQQGHSFSS